MCAKKYLHELYTLPWTNKAAYLFLAKFSIIKGLKPVVAQLAVSFTIHSVIQRPWVY